MALLPPLVSQENIDGLSGYSRERLGQPEKHKAGSFHVTFGQRHCAHRAPAQDQIWGQIPSRAAGPTPSTLAASDTSQATGLWAGPGLIFSSQNQGGKEIFTLRRQRGEKRPAKGSDSVNSTSASNPQAWGKPKKTSGKAARPFCCLFPLTAGSSSSHGNRPPLRTFFEHFLPLTGKCRRQAP